jgi:hypothetical protein
MGLIGNPFSSIRNREGEAVGLTLEMQAAANRMLAAVDHLAGEDRPHPLWLDKSNDVANTYHRGALIDVEQELIRDESLRVLPAYVQLFTARTGRIRATLNAIAERLATRDFHRTMGEWLKVVVAEPDDQLPEYALTADGAWDELVEQVASDPTEAFIEHFGESVLFRSQDRTKEHDVREASLEEEPEEVETSDEEDELTADQPFVEEQVELEDPIVEYVIAYTKEHLSPVVARGLRAYFEQGFGEVVTELKITKAPRKTLKALLRLAALRYRKVIVMFDEFNNWAFMPEDLQHKYVASLTELRLIMADTALMVFMIGTDTAPEIEEQFSSGEQVSWAMPGVRKLAEDIDALDPEMVQSWIDSATLPGSEPMKLSDGVLAELAVEADGSLDAFVPMAAAAVENAVDRGASSLGDPDKQAGLDARTETEEAASDSE